MISLFSRSSLVVLESLSFTRTLYAFDFDGTLAKIVPRPDDARMSPTTEGLLRRLAELAPVAIVSGRSIEDLRKRIGFEPKHLIGNHGLQGLGTDRGSLDAAAEICRAWQKTLAAQVWPVGVEVEDKKYSLAIHYRRARKKREARLHIEAAVQTLDPAPRIIEGKLVRNLLPAESPHKGAAILDLQRLSGMQHVFYIGDDDTDEDVFSLPYTFGQILSVRVGRKKTSRASYYIDRQSEINRVLRAIIAFHEHPADMKRARRPVP